MNLAEHIAGGGTHELETRADGWVRCACRRWGDPATFMDRRLREDLPYDWDCPACWSVEAREWERVHRSLRPAVLSNDMYERVAQMMEWTGIPDWREARRLAYLAAWPLDKQAEATTDAANGDTTKLDQMNADFDAIRAAIPKPAKVVVINGVEWPSDLPEAHIPQE